MIGGLEFHSASNVRPALERLADRKIRGGPIVVIARKAGIETYSLFQEVRGILIVAPF